MSNKALTVRELLNGTNNISPMDIDTTEIRELSQAMPKDGNIDLNNAEVLATKYLRGADLCSELLAIATAHVQRADSLKKKAFSKAALENADQYFTDRNNGKRPEKITDKMRVLYADQDEEYLNACEVYNTAIAFAKWVGSKYDSFNKMHYMCKKILDRGYTHERMSNFNGTMDYEDNNGEIKDLNKEEDNDEEWWDKS